MTLKYGIRHRANCPKCGNSQVRVLSRGYWTILCRCENCGKDFLIGKNDLMELDR